MTSNNYSQNAFKGSTNPITHLSLLIFLALKSILIQSVCFTILEVNLSSQTFFKALETPKKLEGNKQTSTRGGVPNRYLVF